MEQEKMMDAGFAAKLAQIALDPDEKSRMDGELSRTFARLRQAFCAFDVAGVAPMIYGGTAQGGWRPDTPGPMLDRGEVLQQAPERLGDEFKVPRIVE